jgi:hypothetical protein
MLSKRSQIFFLFLKVYSYLNKLHYYCLKKNPPSNFSSILGYLGIIFKSEKTSKKQKNVKNIHGIKKFPKGHLFVV